MVYNRKIPICTNIQLVFSSNCLMWSQEKANLHWSQKYDFSRLCSNSTVLFKRFFKLLVWQKKNSHWLHLYDFSPVYVFFSNCLMRKGRVTLITQVWLFSTVRFLNISSKCLYKRKQSFTCCIYTTLQCVFSFKLPNEVRKIHIDHTSLTIPHCAF